MNPASGDKAPGDSVMNLDMEWMQHLYAGLARQQSESSRSSSVMDEELQMELINIINNADKRSRTTAVTAINSDRIGSCYLAAGMKPDSDMRRIAASLINSVEATSVTTRVVPRSACGLEMNNMLAAANTASGFQRYSSALSSGRAVAAGGAAAAGGLPRGTGAVKVKKKRIRPSRRVPTTVVKTDPSNFKAMVEQFTGIPPTITSNPESTAATSTSPSAPQSSNSTTSPSFSKPLPHPVLCKISNSSSMAEHLTSTPPTTTTTRESTASPSASSSSPQSTSPARSASFRKPLPHPAVCKTSNSYTAPPNPDTSVAPVSCPSPLLSSSFPTCQSMPDLPFLTTATTTTPVSGYIPNSTLPEELTMTSLIDADFFELWNYSTEH